MTDQTPDTEYIIPKHLHDQFVSLHKQLEKETGIMFELSFNAYGDMRRKTITIGNIETRLLPIKIYNMLPEYEALNGMYGSIKEARDTVEQFSLRDYSGFWDRVMVCTNGKKVYRTGGRCGLAYELHEIGDYEFLEQS